MKLHRKNLSKLLLSIFSLILLLLIGVLTHQIKETKNYISAEAPLCLQTSVRQIVEHKAKDIYYAAQYKYDPNERKIGEYETRTARYADTIFEYQSRIVDPGTSAFRGFQTLLLDINRLHADSIQILFDSLLQKKNIHVESIVGITASFYTKINEWSGDTTAININYRTEYTDQGDYEDIDYYAYIHYSPDTIWTLMPKKAIYPLFIACIISGLILLWWLRKRKEEKKNGIVLLKNGDYRIKEIKFNVNERRLFSEESGQELTLTQQLNDLLLLFLEAGHHRVSKEDIKQKFWFKSSTAATNMTSAISRLNKILKDINCAYTIITDPGKEEYYIFSLTVRDGKASKEKFSHSILAL